MLLISKISWANNRQLKTQSYNFFNIRRNDMYNSVSYYSLNLTQRLTGSYIKFMLQSVKIFVVKIKVYIFTMINAYIYAPLKGHIQ